MGENTLQLIDNVFPDLEQMKKLYKDEEILDIIEKRKEYDKKVERTIKEKQDFENCIHYEISLIRNIIMRKNKNNITAKSDKNEYSIAKRITKIYKIALSYFKTDEKLWMSYINFCTQTRFNHNVSEAFIEMLQVLGDKIHLWKDAARWELDKLKNPDGAINILKSGLKRHPSAKELYLEAFKIELASAVNTTYPKTIDAKTEQQNEAVSRAEVYFKTSVIEIKEDIEFVTALLDIANEFDFASELQTKIVEHLRLNYKKEELMWHTMAQRELKRNNLNSIRTCIAIYKSAVKLLSTNSMWEMYLDTLVELYLNEHKFNEFLSERLKDAFNEAYNNSRILEKHFVVWIDMMDDTKCLDVLTKATGALPQSVNLWMMRLRYHTLENNAEQILSVANEALAALKEKSLPIYKCLIHYYNLRQNSFSDVKGWYEKGIADNPDVSLALRPQYIEWMCLIKNLKHARMEYETLAKLIPYCLELHQKMLELEYSKLGSLNLEAIKSVHELACEQFGKTRHDVWFDYVKFDRDYLESKFTPIICQNAKNNLDKKSYDAFTVDYNTLNIL